MSSNGDYTYNSAHMEEISSQYKNCTEFAEQAIDDLDKAKMSFLGNYKGQSDDMAPELFAKLKEHMELLRDCFSQMETYVTYTKDTMAEMDNKLGSVIMGGGNGGVR